MNYESLYKLYYKNPTHYEAIYAELFHSPFTKHLPISINPFNLIRQKSSTSKVGDEGRYGEFT